MGPVHQWQLEKCARFCGGGGNKTRGLASDDASSSRPEAEAPETGTLENGWRVYTGSNVYVTILNSAHLVISFKNQVLESFALFNSGMWMKAIRKGDSLLLLHKVQNNTRKLRMKFSEKVGKSAEDVCSESVGILRAYFPIKSLDEPEELTDRNSQSAAKETPESITDISNIYKKLTMPDETSLPLAYTNANMPLECVGGIVKLCLTDPHFPAFVQRVSDELEKQISLGEVNME